MVFLTKFKRPDNPAIDFSKCERLVAVEFAREADINFLLARYKNTGSLYTADEMLKAKARPRFGDFTAVPDFQTQLDKMREAIDLFGDLPLALRQRFSDDPVQLLEFLQDEKNVDEAVKLGLVVPQAKDEPHAQKGEDVPPKPQEAA